MPTAYFFTKTKFFRAERGHQGRFSKFESTVEYYSQHGVDCLIFWDHELENEQAVVDTVRRWC